MHVNKNNRYMSQDAFCQERVSAKLWAFREQCAGGDLVDMEAGGMFEEDNRQDSFYYKFNLYSLNR